MMGSAESPDGGRFREASPRALRTNQRAQGTAAGDPGLADRPTSLTRSRDWVILGFITAVQLSIAVAQSLLAIAVALWIVDLARRRAWPATPPIWGPLAWYGAITLISSAFSLHPAASFVDSKQLVLFAIVPLVYDSLRGRSVALAVGIVLAVGCVAAFVGLVQYWWFNLNSVQLRPHGTLGHYMTYSGQLMLTGTAALSHVLFGARMRAVAAAILACITLALVVTFTRNAWLGAIAAAAVLLLARDLRLLILVPLAAGLVYAFAPAAVETRMRTIFSLEDQSSQERVLLAESGLRMIRDRPLVGVGPNVVKEVYPRYRMPGAFHAINPHLHNDFLQIAAERGLPALAVWLWFVVRVLRELAVLRRRHRERALAAGASAAMVAMLVAGQFEYNFGDSEFLMLLLVIITLPFAAATTGESAVAPATANRP